MKALGLIETMGLTVAIEAADAMLKAADVRLLERVFVGSGLVTVSVTGEVSAVQASVDAGVAAVKRICAKQLVSRHVIPRPDSTLEGVIFSVSKEGVKEAFSGDKEKTSEGINLSRTEAETAKQVATTGKKELSSVEDITPKSVTWEEEGEQIMIKAGKMTLAKLRELARSYDSFPLTAQQIGKKSKKELLDALETYYRSLSDK